MPTFRFEPIATQLAKSVSPELLFPAEVLEQIRHESGLATAPEGADEMRQLMPHYAAVVSAAHLLLGAPPCERLAWLEDELERAYQPGGPPRSPVYDSFLMQHVLGGVPLGLAGETPYGLLARLSKGDPARARLCELAESLARSHPDVYRVTTFDGRVAELLPLRAVEPFPVHVAGPFLRAGDLILARTIAFGGARFLVDLPYLLDAPESDWTDYFGRVAAAHAPSTGDATPQAKPRLTSKQAARLRQQQKARAASHTPQETVTRHLRSGPSEHFWLQYVLNAATGERRGIVRLAGVPDRHGPLPEGSGFGSPTEAEAAPQLSVMGKVRTRLVAIARREGLLAREQQALEQVIDERVGEGRELDEDLHALLTTYCALAARTARGDTALQLLEREDALDAGERELVDALKRSFFALLRVDHVDLDEGFDALDLVRGQRLHVSDGAAAQQVALGELLLGWVWRERAEQLSLEGVAVLVPEPMAPQLGELATALGEQRRASFPEESADERAARLVPALLTQLAVLREQARLHDAPGSLAGDSESLFARLRQERRAGDVPPSEPAPH